MNWGDYIQAALSLIFVLALIGLLTVVARRFGFGSPTPTLGHKNKRGVILEVTNLEMKRKLVLVRRDNREHLILLGINAEQIVESYDATDIPSIDTTGNSFSNALETELKQDI